MISENFELWRFCDEKNQEVEKIGKLFRQKKAQNVLKISNLQNCEALLGGTRVVIFLVVKFSTVWRCLEKRNHEDGSI